MQSPFNFELALLAEKDTQQPVRMVLTTARESQSRRRGYVVGLGVRNQEADKQAELVQIRLGLN